MSGLSIIHSSPFYELTALVVIAAVIGFVGVLLRQPMIVSFIAVGVLAGPSALNIVQSHEHIQLLAELGIAVLLFLVGLKLDLKLIRTLGPVALATGLGQVAFTSAIGFVLGKVLGLDTVTSLYVAVALTFSSTIIIVKLLSDKREVDSLHGRIAVGFLIVQDLVVVLAMMVLSAFGIGAQTRAGETALIHIGSVLIYGLMMLCLVLLFIRYLAIPLVSRVARSQELLVTFAIGWAALLAAIGNHLGFSKELGGLLAGISLASTPFREAIVARLASLRDFLLLFFFIALGMQLDLGLLGSQVIPALVFSVFVLIGNPLIVMAIMGYMGYRKRTGFLAGLTVAQISEFSLIIVAMGLSLGHIPAKALGLVTLVGLITIAMSVYMITYSHSLYSQLEPWLGFFERSKPYREEALERQPSSIQPYNVILFGLGRYGKAIAHYLQKEGFSLLAVDFNPDEVRRWRSQGHMAMYGDACDPAFVSDLPLQGVEWVVSAMPQHDIGVTHEDPRLSLIEGLKQQQYTGGIAISTQHLHDQQKLKDRGATLILLPFHDAAEQAVERMKAVSHTSNTKKNRL
ncbi:Kef-type K+ transport system, predicted NAD-binding component [Hahella chejuensis KCTC 2396]|uniref:Kef-type K+ transport system, predicted NAD-binding component n=1 Tax=Hahella chejuensis (strain KCTC 2396) TaxID=349521 RepID=Q2S7A0_HAHCH|nr:cation:proton antiporter [Hahella chejuensis]ABC33474.1 Kef-type K+ transport system, predicted NAD-binding component [Hahella chejuensis KCTC 2396]